MAVFSKYLRDPVKYSGTLDSYEFFEVTPCTGREYAKLSIRDVLNAPNSDDMIRDFSVLVSTMWRRLSSNWESRSHSASAKGVHA
jgi:hypothetical protein